MGNYIPFDRKKAEAYARALRKRQRRKQKETEEKLITDQLIAEEVAKKIEAIRNRSKEPVVKMREQKPKPDHAAMALQRSLDIIRSQTTSKVNSLKGATKVGGSETAHFVNTRDRKYLNRAAYLAYHRYSGRIGGRSRARRSFLKWSERAIELSEKAGSVLIHEALLSATAVRMAAREEMKLLNRDERRRIVDMWNVRRKLYAQIGDREDIILKWLDVISRSYD
jgi:hypothetical protein